MEQTSACEHNMVNIDIKLFVKVEVQLLTRLTGQWRSYSLFSEVLIKKILEQRD